MTQETKIEYELAHIDTCLSDYWPGHHLPHIAIPVWPKMTLESIKQALTNELNQDAILGNFPNDAGITKEGFFIEAKKAINNLTPNNPNQKTFFNDIENSEDDSDSLIYAYFVFIPKNT